MPLFRSVCAVDLSEHTKRVIYHAAGLVGATGARLTILHVADERHRDERALDVQRALIDAVPYGATYLPDTTVVVESGDPVDVIKRLAQEHAADLIVCGSRGRAGLARLLLGSTGAGLLQTSDRPVFLVAPTDWDVVTLGIDRVSLNFGAVVAAVDLGDLHHPHLHVASALAALAGRNLLVMTVGLDGRDDHQLAKELRARVHGLEPASPHAIIVRRGEVAQEIARCAVAESAGLVVMGAHPRAGQRGSGSVALEVLQTRRAHVLVVPTTPSL